MNIARNKVNIYACGGAAANIVYDLEGQRDEPRDGFAQLVPYYLDTSRANYKNKDLDNEYIYLFEGKDGSGGQRASNYEDIDKQALAILQRFKPTEFNLVVHSASGGSGSVLGPVLVSELKAKGHQVIALVVGATDSQNEIKNTIEVLKSYEGIAEELGQPVIVYYEENSADFDRFKVNDQMKYAINMLSGLFSGQLDELDTADLKSWLNYTKFTKSRAQLASLQFAGSAAEMKGISDFTSVVSISKPTVATRLPSIPAYHKAGLVPSSWHMGAVDGEQLIGDHPLHFIISDDFIARAMKHLTTDMKDVKDTFASRVGRDSLLQGGDKRTKRGIVIED